MKDQCDTLRKRGVADVQINSAMDSAGGAARLARRFRQAIATPPRAL